MARNDLTVTTAAGPNPTAGEELTWEAAAPGGDGEQFPLTGREILLAWNTSADTDYYVTIESVADPFNREGDITQEDVAFGEVTAFGPFSLEGWKQSNGMLFCNAENAAIVFAVLRF